MKRRLLVTIAAVLLGAWLPGQGVRAQVGPLFADPVDEAPAAAAVGAAEVRIAAGDFGVGSVVRPGDWAGVRLVLSDRFDRPRNVVVRVSIPDPDGDTLWVQREVTLNPGVEQSVWLYARMPWSVSRTTALEAAVYASLSDDASDTDPLRTDVGRLLGATRIAPALLVPDGSGMIGVLGRAPAGGLSAYGLTPDGSDFSGVANELIQIITDIRADDLPDRWQGLAPFAALVWLEGAPGALNDRQAEALREWVRRGGRLIVSLPAFGETWTSPRDNPIHDLLPDVRVERREGFDLERARPLLRLHEGVPLPRRAVVHRLTPTAGAPRAASVPLLEAPGLGVVAVRRLVGAGECTLIGLDLGDPDLGVRVDAQAFWHRVLGQRFDVLSRDQMREMREARAADFRIRDQAWLDTDIAGEISRTGRAGVGVLLGLIVFACYLLLAGPVGFAALKAKKRQRHAWVVFVATAGVFTLIAWGGATTLRPMNAGAQHLTYVDHVFGQGVQRSRIWFGALLPTYGERTVSIGDPADVGRGFNALTPWESPTAAGVTRFPDSRGYVSDARAPHALRVPTRSTVKEFQGEWLGAPTWHAMPQPVDGDFGVENLDGRLRLTGRIAHELPVPLRDVTIVLVERQRPLGTTSAIGMAPTPAVAYAWRVEDMLPAVTYDLGEITRGAPSLAETYFDRLATDAGGPPTLDALRRELRDPRRAPARHEALAWFPMLTQPEFLSRSGLPKRMLQRRSAHTYDLGRWFTQPCLIIVAQMTDVPTPVPLYVDGAPMPSTGRVVLRWVYPLDPAPATAPR
ncbi:MAG: hypothetical protein EA379_03885 [Phycisphaerales bacterium]|nr:MAG: hypothetical protein EA379_03885 [Phycisphaerales bacterium]